MEKFEFLRGQDDCGRLRFGLQIRGYEPGPGGDGTGPVALWTKEELALAAGIGDERPFATRTRERHLDRQNIRAEERKIFSDWSLAIQSPWDWNGARASGAFHDVSLKCSGNHEAAATEGAVKIDRVLGLHVKILLAFQSLTIRMRIPHMVCQCERPTQYIASESDGEVLRSLT